MARKKVGGNEYIVLKLLLGLFVLGMIFLGPAVSSEYMDLLIILLLLGVFLIFVALPIERKKVIIDFSEKKEEDDSPPIQKWGESNSHSPSLSSNPNNLAHNLFDILINDRILYPYLDIGLLIISLFFAVAMLMFSIYNIFLIIIMVILYYVMLDRLNKRYNRKQGTER